MADFDFTEGLKKAFLLGVGAVATGVEKTQELIDELVSKGEITMEQGKALNSELTRKVKETADEGQDALLSAFLKSMSPEERAKWVERASKMAADLDAEPVEVEGEPVEDAPAEDAPAEDAPAADPTEEA